MSCSGLTEFGCGDYNTLFGQRVCKIAPYMVNTRASLQAEAAISDVELSSAVKKHEPKFNNFYSLLDPHCRVKL